MNASHKALLAALATALVAVAVLVPIAGASGSTPNGMMGSPSPSPTMMATATPMPSPSSTMMGTPMHTPSPSPTGGTSGDSWCGGGIWGGSGSWGGTGMWGMGAGASWLTDNPDALAAWLQLKADHLAAMQTWYDTYKDDLTSDAAQQALHDLWTTGWNDMKAFYEQYANGAPWACPAVGMWDGWQGGMMGGSWDASNMWGSGYGASWMTNHRKGFGQWMAMRARQTAAVTAWQQQYAGDLTGSEAQTALQTMRTAMRTQVKAFYRNHHLTVTTARMRYGAGGWMGLGGMWGGWGW